MKTAIQAVFVVKANKRTSLSNKSVHDSYMMKALFKRYRDHVRIVVDGDGIVLRKDCGELAAGGARFESIDTAYEYIRTSKLVTI